MTSYICSKCNYTFDKPEAPSKCPYCGKSGTITKQKSAQELIDESLKEKDFFQK